MVECAILERWFLGNGDKGSNPFTSAKSKYFNVEYSGLVMELGFRKIKPSVDLAAAVLKTVSP